MKLAIIGFGNAGGKIADRLLAFERDTGLNLSKSVSTINSARIDLAKPDLIPHENRYLIGQTHPRVKGHGVGADPDLGAEIAREDEAEIQRTLDDVPIHAIDAFLIIAGLGGGTGSGGAPVLASYIRDLYDEPVYGLGILPSKNETGRAALNAARSIPTFVESTDNLILFDNELWSQGSETIESGYERINTEIAKRIGTLLSAGELDGSTVSENAMDSSDIRRTLETGGISSIAFAEAEVEQSTVKRKGLLSRFQRDGQDPGVNDTATKIDGLVRQAVRSRMTIEAGIESVDRSLIVISGPPAEFSRKGLESARTWLARETGSNEVLAGDDPRQNADTVSAVVLLSNVTDVRRIDQLQEQAVEAQKSFEHQASTRDRDIQQLIRDDGDELDPV